METESVLLRNKGGATFCKDERERMRRIHAAKTSVAVEERVSLFPAIGTTLPLPNVLRWEGS